VVKAQPTQVVGCCLSGVQALASGVGACPTQLLVRWLASSAIDRQNPSAMLECEAEVQRDHPLSDIGPGEATNIAIGVPTAMSSAANHPRLSRTPFFWRRYIPRMSH
jgi:hypothetical protein